MREVGVLEAKTNLSALLDAVERGGEDEIITRNGKPVARLSAASANESAALVRGASGAELAERFARLRDLISSENPETDSITWEELRRLKEGERD